MASTPVSANTLPGSRNVVELGEVVRVAKEAGSPTVFRRDGRFADMVMAELAGSYEAPIYGMLEVAHRVDIMVGHWLFAAPFTATSMIGFIALAGIIVRNSILLVDFIRHGRQPDRSLRDVLLEAGAVRFKPILLMALAAMIGAATTWSIQSSRGLPSRCCSAWRPPRCSPFW
jgi:hypothetical protein